MKVSLASVGARATSRASIVAVLLSCAMLSTSPRVALAGPKEECVDASDKAQTLRAEKKLRAARTELLLCARDVCPDVVKTDCGQWLSEVTASLPTVVISATDASGNEVNAVRVTMDGEVIAEKLEGVAIAVDPGLHLFRYEGPAGAKPVEANVTINQGEKNRALKITFDTGEAPKTKVGAPIVDSGTSAAPSSSSSSSKIPAATFIFGAASVVALGSFAFFGLTGRHDVSQLRDTCAPACDESDKKAARNKLLVADVSLGVGIVSLGLATWFYLARSSSSDRPTSASTTALSIDIAQIAGGGVGFVGGRF